MTKKTKIILLFEQGLSAAEIKKETGSDERYIMRVKKALKESGLQFKRKLLDKPKAGTKSELAYLMFERNRNAKAWEVAKALGISPSLCQEVRGRYFGISSDPLKPKKLKAQILPQPKAMFDVELSELTL
jgi:hypothetical protein